MGQDRARSFGSVAALYDESRPGPPTGLGDEFGPLEGLDVLEVAAGTGLVTRFLFALGANVTTVEPDADMRAVLEARSPEVHSLSGTAEALPVPDESFDVVVTSSAWHWFDQPDAAHEFARVLRDGGRLYVLGNSLDRDHQWLEDLAALRDVNDQSWGARRAKESASDLTDEFVTPRDIAIDWTWTRTHDQLVQLFYTYSGVITAAGEERREVESKVRSELARLAPEGTLEVPMVLRGVQSTRRARDRSGDHPHGHGARDGGPCVDP